MKRKQYFISTKDGKIEVTGYPVVIPGYEQFSFFAHHPYYHSHHPNIDSFSGEDWTISEAITGMSVSPHSYPDGMSNSTRAGALAIVVERFKSMGADYILSRLQAAVKAAQDEATGVMA